MELIETFHFVVCCQLQVWRRSNSATAAAAKASINILAAAKISISRLPADAGCPYQWTATLQTRIENYCNIDSARRIDLIWQIDLNPITTCESICKSKMEFLIRGWQSLFTLQLHLFRQSYPDITSTQFCNYRHSEQRSFNICKHTAHYIYCINHPAFMLTSLHDCVKLPSSCRLDFTRR